MDKKAVTIWSIVVIVLTLVVVGAFALVTAPKQPTAGVLSLPVQVDDWTIGGTASSTVSLVEYSDFQCPACAFYAGWVKQLVKDVPELALTYRYFPLNRTHQNADLAARAAEAAGKQDKFWEMHDLLFDRQKDWEKNSEAEKLFTDYAQSLGVDAVKFQQDLNSQETKDRILRDYQSGVDSGVVATPSFYLNGKFIENPKTYEDFVQIIKDALAASTPITS